MFNCSSPDCHLGCIRYLVFGGVEEHDPVAVFPYATTDRPEIEPGRISCFDSYALDGTRHMTIRYTHNLTVFYWGGSLSDPIGHTFCGDHLAGETTCADRASGNDRTLYTGECCRGE